jgi:hypothetical protein
MGKEWLWWLGEFGLAATVAVVAGFVTRDVPISILYGLFVGTVFFALRELRRVISQFSGEVANIEDKALNLPVTLSKLADADPYLKHLAHSAKDEALRFVKGAVDGEIVMKVRHMIQISIELIKQAQPGDRVLATNYWASYYYPQTDIWRQTCFDAAAKGVDFTRVFIEGVSFTHEEKKRQREEMDRQKDHLNVRCVKESLLPPEARRNFILIFDRIFGYAAMTRLGSVNKGISFEDIRLYTRHEELEEAKELAETIIKLSEEYK